MADDLYDEFGNYIGPELSDSDQDEEAEVAEDGVVEEGTGDEDMEEADGHGGDDDDEPIPNAVVLAEDKKYYPSADEVYGAGTEALVMEEDAQPLEVPIIAPVKDKKHERLLSEPLRSTFTPEFMATLMSNGDLVRHVAVAGALHHGKTTLMDMLVEQTHELPPSKHPLRFTDTRIDEQSRGISIKMVPMSLVLEGGSGKSFLLNLMDCPGHVNFNDEVTAAMRLADGLLLVVDALEGVVAVTERAARQAVAEGLAVTLIISKVDRLVLELKLPPGDAYFKLKHTIEEVNKVLYEAAGVLPGSDEAVALALDPLKGNVAFCSAQYGWSFTLDSFAAMYAEVYGEGGRGAGSQRFDPYELSRRLWGDVWYSPETRTFRRKAGPGCERSFVAFVLEPLYKLTAAVISEHPRTVERVLGELGVALRPSQYNQDVKPLLKDVCRKVFGGAAGLVDMLVAHVPSAKRGTAEKVTRHYSGPLDPDSLLAKCMVDAAPRGPLVFHVAKLYPKQDGRSFDALGRVISGTLRPGDRVRVLGEGYTPEDEEDSALAEITNVWVYQARYRLPVSKATAGNLVLVEGLDAVVAKTATVVPEAFDSEDVYIFRPLRFQTLSVVKIATEPLNPSELPKMVEGLRRVNKSYPLVSTKVEESGEHTILGTGELYLDSVMKDLREMYAEVEVKVADPVVSFCETVVETSSLKCFAESPNKRNKLTMVAEPLDKGLAEDIERGAVSLEWPLKRISEFLETKYDWDKLAARSVWAFGPGADGPNVLLDDTLSTDVDKGLLGAIRSSVVQGFQWGAREGPLCDEPLRDVKFKVMDAVVADEPLARGGGQIIPTARRVCYSAFLMASPRLMEPVYYVEIMTPADCISAIYNVLAKRRGHVTADLPKPGTPIFIVQAFLPVIESFGFETDLRYHTQGQAFCQSVFDHWQVVPGDPLDRSVVLRPLEPAPVAALAREFCVKTRRRKGMSEDVSVAKFFDDPMLLELARQDAELQGLGVM
ncbi:MAG: elongation factor EF-Tu-like protein [Monoraphidium minutum]|nr:MAG: elongation factor EF-Tu-like protein [Monoraphidium minutum]